MKQHYDVCVVGVWPSMNYGSLLNGYSLYKILKSLGKEVLMLHKITNKSKDDWELKGGHNVQFINQYYDPEDISPSYNHDELNSVNKICDCFCTGSDQIWRYSVSFGGEMYLPFVEDGKKIISFATSFGTRDGNIPPEKQSFVKNCLRRYSAISVREQFDVDLLKEKYGLNGKLVFEPVFCIDKSIYTTLLENASFKSDSNYLLTYILDPTPAKKQAIESYSKMLNLPVINLLDGGGNWEKNSAKLGLESIIKNPSVENFLKMFSCADFIITDSFHGTAFSIIFERKFISIGNYSRGFDRFIDLLGRLNLMDRLVSDPANIPVSNTFLENINYSKVNSLIKNEANSAVTWLSNILDTPLEKLPTNKFDSILHHKYECIGCSSCANTCPKQAINLGPNDYGYYVAHIDSTKCVGCGKCVSVCPAICLPFKTNSSNPECYEFINSDENLVYDSTSGGIFTALATQIIHDGGAVAGAAWTDNFTVEHILVKEVSELYKLRKSKYLQSYLGTIFKSIKAELQGGKPILFSGCPCQVAGLKKYLKKDYKNLYTVDLLCGNAPSPLFFKKYLMDQFPEGIKNYQFRSKERGWNAETIEVIDSNDNCIVLSGKKEDMYQRVYHNHTMCPPHCEHCKYQSLPRYGDITIGDFWGISNKDPLIYTKAGVSAVLCNNEKGQLLIKSIPSESIKVLRNVPLDWLGGNGFAINNHNYASSKRNLFYKYILSNGFKDTLMKLKPALPPTHLFENTAVIHMFNIKTNYYRLDRNIWDQQITINGLELRCKLKEPIFGKYASLPLYKTLRKGHKYRTEIEFDLKTGSNILNLHIKDSSCEIHQIIHSISVDKSITSYPRISFEFIPDYDQYDEFMIGAAHVVGPGNYFRLRILNILEE